MKRLIAIGSSPRRSLASFVKRCGAVVCAVLLLAACDSSGTRLPVAPGPEPTPDPPAGPHTLSGTVTSAGQPAIGARVTVVELVPELSATTDHAGKYRISDPSTSFFWGRTLVRFSQPGYFTEYKRPYIGGDSQLDMNLDPLNFVTLGHVVRGTITAGAAACAGKDYDEGPCQRFAVIPSAEGTLEVTLMATGGPAAAALDVINAAGDVFAQFLGQPKRVSIPVRAGETWEIRVVIDGVARVDYELTTSMR